MKFWITLEGREAEVEMAADGDRVWLEIDGKRRHADFRRLPDGEVYSLLMDGRAHVVRVAPNGRALDVTIRGTTIPIDVRHPLEKFVQSTKGPAVASAETIESPMPGLVVAIRVEAGQAVTAGQAVAVIEAMKMQNELTAKHAGIVSEVLVRPGDSVAARQGLIRMRPATP